MNQHRVSGYARVARDAYPTLDAWVVDALLACFPMPKYVWEPACGEGHMVRHLRARGHVVAGTDIHLSGNDFLKAESAPFICRFAAITNPPFGARGVMAEAFAWKALELTHSTASVTALLLPADFDHAGKRLGLFGHQAYCMRIVLLARPRWFEGKSSPKTNFVWHIWDHHNKHAPIVAYAGRQQ